MIGIRIGSKPKRCSPMSSLPTMRWFSGGTMDYVWITQFVTLWISSVLRLSVASCPQSCSNGGYCGGRQEHLPEDSRRNKIVSLLENYDNLVRPNSENDIPTEVVCDIFVNSIDSVSVDAMDFSVNIYLRQSWLDPRLKFAHRFPNISSLSLDSKMFDLIWVPDLFFPNEKEAHSHCITMPNRLIRIYPNGTILYSARYTLRLTCHMSLEDFPFDRQKCYLVLESFAYTLTDMVFHWRDTTPIQMNEKLTLPQFQLTKNYTGDCKKSYITGDFTCLKATFELHRKYGYYVIQNYVPSFLIVSLSWVSFWINIDAVPARISLGVLTVLTMTTQSVGVWMSLPRVSYVKALDIWMSTSVLFVFASMLEFAIVNTLARKEIKRMSIRARERVKPGQDNHDIIKQMRDEYTYGKPQQFDPTSRMLARRVDKASRVLFPSSFIAFNFIYWCFFLIK